MVVIAKDNDTNILRSAVFRELRQLDELIRNTTATYDGENYVYSEICAKWLGQCATNDILELDQVIELVYMYNFLISCFLEMMRTRSAFFPNDERELYKRFAYILRRGARLI